MPWSRWHSRAAGALGTAWLFDGLEVTIVADAEREPLEAIARPLVQPEK